MKSIWIWLAVLLLWLVLSLISHLQKNLNSSLIKYIWQKSTKLYFNYYYMRMIFVDNYYLFINFTIKLMLTVCRSLRAVCHSPLSIWQSLLASGYSLFNIHYLLLAVYSLLIPIFHLLLSIRYLIVTFCRLLISPCYCLLLALSYIYHLTFAKYWWLISIC